MSRTRNVTRNLAWGFINKIMSTLLPFAFRTIMLYKLGELYVGISSLFTSILGVLSLSELGLGEAIVYSMYKPMAEGDDEKVCSLLNFYKKCYRMIGLVIGVLGLALLPFIKNLIKGEYPEDINIYIIYLLLLTNNVMSYLLFAYKNSLLQAGQRTDVASNISTAVLMISYVVQIPILLITSNYYYYILVTVAGTLLNNLCTYYVIKKLYPHYTARGKLEQKNFKELKVQLAGLIIRKFGNIILGFADNIVISSFIGLAVLARYNNYYMIVNALFGFISIVSVSLKNSVGNAIVTESTARNYNDFKTFDTLYTFSLSTVALCFLNFAQPFIRLWLGEGRTLGDDIVVLLAVYLFIYKWCDMLYVYQEALGLWWQTKIIPMVAAIINLIINIILVNWIGLPGIIISTIVSIFFIYDIGYARILYREYFNEAGRLREYIFCKGYQLCSFGIVVLYSIFMWRFQPESLPLIFVYRALACILPAGVVSFLSYGYLPEYKESKKYLKKMLKRN